jgi:glutathione S-transferase
MFLHPHVFLLKLIYPLLSVTFLSCNHLPFSHLSLQAIAMNVFHEQRGRIALYTSPRTKEGATIAMLIELIGYAIDQFLQRC